MRRFNRQTLLAVIATVALVLAVLVMWAQQRPDAPSNLAWYYDLADGTLFPGPADQIAPIAAPSGPDNGVLAHVYACGNCNAETREIAYLETNTPHAKQVLRTMPTPGPDVDVAPYVIEAQQGRRIAKTPPPGQTPQWIAAMHPDADAIRHSVGGICADGRPVRCTP